MSNPEIIVNPERTQRLERPKYFHHDRLHLDTFLIQNQNNVLFNHSFCKPSLAYRKILSSNDWLTVL